MELKLMTLPERLKRTEVRLGLAIRSMQSTANAAALTRLGEHQLAAEALVEASVLAEGLGYLADPGRLQGELADILEEMKRPVVAIATGSLAGGPDALTPTVLVHATTEKAVA